MGTEDPFKCFVALSDAFFAAALDDRLWPSALDALRRRFDGSRGALGTVAGAESATLFGGDCGPEFAASFFEPRLGNPFGPRLLRNRAPEAFSDQMVLSRRDLRRTLFYDEWLAPQGAESFLAAKAPVGARHTALICLHRGGRRAEFDAGDVEMLGRLAPVFSQAARLSLRLREAEQGLGGRGIGRILVDAEARVLTMDARAEAQLDAHPEIAIVGRRIAVTATPAGGGLGKLVAAACRGEAGGLGGGSGGDLLVRSARTGLPELVLTVAPFTGAAALDLPVARAAAILIQDLRPGVDARAAARLAALFGLTPREAELATALAGGASLRDHAAARGVSHETTRTHLRSLFAKTGTARQAELVALLFRAATLAEAPTGRE
ncbi:MAG: hypothetical protein DI556_18815 [Rhodovulum sulfidophilum]|uniref:HTH luxR-type domain-containing protein n=1 Tax=Rhodovulum sulfidophilum TaxID=35806 RepID=A0A2W5N3U5_RHOSU|nr:MAG: hypothetical protein DI556_18815 [Rhodovulum sulfidophilum]